MSLGKLEVIPGFHFYIKEINSKHQSSFLFSLKVELMFLLFILNRLKSFRWYFLMFANNWIYWKVELLQHVNTKHNNKFYLRMKVILAVMCTTWAVLKIKPEKKFRPVRDLNPWPQRYQCSALPTELTSQLGAAHTWLIMLAPNKPVKWLING